MAPVVGHILRMRTTHLIMSATFNPPVPPAVGYIFKDTYDPPGVGYILIHLINPPVAPVVGHISRMRTSE